MNTATEPTLREMKRKDIPDVLRIVRIHDTDDAQNARAHLNELFGENERINIQNSAYYVLEVVNPLKQKEIIGVCGFGPDEEEGEDVYWLGWTYIHPDYRRKGYGKRLFQKVIDDLKQLGGRKLFVSTSNYPTFQTAVEFYQSMGFQLEGTLKDYFYDGENNLILGLHL